MFDINEEQDKMLEVWVREQDTKTANKHCGCSGGAYTYCFTPTNLGMVVKVKNNITQEEIDLTDYKNW